MTPNNNFSVLPWYTSIDERNSKKWWVYDKIYPLFTPAGTILPFQIIRPHALGGIAEFKLFSKTGELIGDFSSEFRSRFRLVTFAEKGYDVIVYSSQGNIFGGVDNGQYYATLKDSADNMWYSEIFTVVNDISGYLKLMWWDNQDFFMDDAAIIYALSSGTQPFPFQNVLYLCSDIAKPEYDFEDEIIERDGYTFPVKQISEKRYRFSFLAPEYLLDAMRFIRMSDNIIITKDGKRYENIDSFLLTPKWEDYGDVAVVDVEFTTDTVAKKIGVGYINSQN